MDKLLLPTVTLVGCTARDHLETLLALQHTTKLVKVANVVFFSDVDPFQWFGSIAEDIDNLTYVPCPKFIEYHDVCIWFMTEYWKHAHLMQNHILSIHHDGYPVNVKAWEPRFLDYDFIGSPWPNKLVGNNGFCLYSQKLLAGIKALNLPPTAEACHGSDKKICLVYRQQLIDFGVKFCPYDFAFKFSTETYGYYDNPHGFKYNGSFGFHGVYSITGMNNFDVQLPPHHLQWLDFKGDEKLLLSVPEFLANNPP